MSSPCFPSSGADTVEAENASPKGPPLRAHMSCSAQVAAFHRMSWFPISRNKNRHQRLFSKSFAGPAFPS